MASSVRHDRQPIPFWQWHVGEDLQKIEHLVDRVDPDRIGLAEGGVIDLVASDNAPVWDDAALEPELVRPDLSTMMGLFLLASRS